MSYYPKWSEFNYSSLKKHEKIIHALFWYIPKFLTVAKCKFIKTCQTEYVDNIVQDEQFRLKIEFFGINRDLIKIYYLYRTNVVLDVRMLQNIRLETLIEKKNCMVTANKWHHLITLNKEAIIIAYNGEFRLMFEFIVTSNVPNDVTLIEHLPEQKLCNDFEDMLISSEFHDVILQSAQGYKFKAHKAVLSCHSSVFQVQFAHDTCENKVNTVTSLLDTDVLKEVLIYIYTDIAPRVQVMPNILLEAAEYYHLEELKKISEEILHLELTKDNAIETLLLADLYSAPYLKKLTLQFIKDGYAHLITKSNGWKALMATDLIKDLYEFIVAPPEQ